MGVLSYILSPNLINKNSEIFSSSFQNNSKYCKFNVYSWIYPLDYIYNNIELVPFKGGQYVRAAGTGRSNFTLKKDFGL